MVATETIVTPLPKKLFALPMGDPLPLPTQQPRPLTITDPVQARVLETKLAEGERLIVLIRAGLESDPAYEQIGVLSTVHQIVRTPDQHLQVLLRPMQRVHIEALIRSEPYTVARVEPLGDEDPEEETIALGRTLAQQFALWLDMQPQTNDDGRNMAAIRSIAADLARQPGPLSDFVASVMDLEDSHLHTLLEQRSTRLRLDFLLPIMESELQMLEVGAKIQQQVRRELGQGQREHYLREQLKAIQQELGSQGGDIESLRERLAAAKLSDAAASEAERELERLDRMPEGSAEGGVVRSYLEALADLPWQRRSRQRDDVSRTRKILAQDHEGLDAVKERILEYVAVRKLTAASKGGDGAARTQVLCFVGPPGVGKTSLARSIARSLGRNYLRLSLGGVRDEAEIRGHRRTYVGAMPGRLIQGLRNVGQRDPVIVLDEIDKLGADFRGDPSAALLEVLDPEQNHSFVDHYLDVPFDLSGAVFIATANGLDSIPPALLDRMEVIQLPGYSDEDKVRIARRHLLPRQMRTNGLGRRRVNIDDDALRQIIRGYTREAGVRNLERELAQVGRKIAREVVDGGRGPFEIDVETLPDYLGPAKINEEDDIVDADLPGIVSGLAWTPAGGEVLVIEASKMRGEGMQLTGQLGDVMKESATIALSYVRAHAEDWKIDETLFEEQALHVHLPAGAVPKDGPSAGVGLALSLLSLLSDRPVRSDVAVTGELTLRGRVLPVGGIEQKVLAAKRNGKTTIIMPRRNARDLDELTPDVREALDFVLVDHFEEAVAIALRESRTDQQLAERID